MSIGASSIGHRQYQGKNIQQIKILLLTWRFEPSIILVPFFIFYFVMELATAIGYIYMVVKKRLALRWPAILCCSFCTLMMIELLNLTGNWVIHDIVTARESFGWVLMMATGILHTKRTMAK